MARGVPFSGRRAIPDRFRAATDEGTMARPRTVWIQPDALLGDLRGDAGLGEQFGDAGMQPGRRAADRAERGSARRAPTRAAPAQPRDDRFERSG